MYKFLKFFLIYFSISILFFPISIFAFDNVSCDFKFEKFLNFQMASFNSKIADDNCNLSANEMVVTNNFVNTIKYVYNNGSDDKSVFFTSDYSSVIENDPKKDNYNFNGWFNDDELITSLDQLEYLKDHVLHAKYTYVTTDIFIQNTNEEISTIKEPVHLIFVVDKSGSMSSSSKNTVIESINTILTTTDFAEGSIFSLFYFASFVSDGVSYTKNTNDIIYEIENNFVTGGGTYYIEALKNSIILAEGGIDYNIDKNGTFVIFLSDGSDNGDDYTDDLSLLDNLVNSIFTIELLSVASLDLNEVASNNCPTRENSLCHFQNNDADFNELVNILQNVVENLGIYSDYEISDGRFIIKNRENVIINVDSPFTIYVNDHVIDFYSYDELVDSEIFGFLNEDLYLDLEALDVKYNVII